MRLTGRTIRQVESLLCGCACHACCPLAGEAAVAQHRWHGECTCRGAQSQRERMAESRRRRKDRAARWARARDSADVDAARSVHEVRSELERALAEQGLHPPAALVDIAATLAMIQRGPRALAGVRSILVLVRPVPRVVRYLRRHGTRIRRGPC